MINYKIMYFAAPELDISKILTSVGCTVAIGETTIAWAYEFGDLGGEPENLDCTPLSSKVRMNKAGVIEQENWTLDYYYNKADFDAIETLKKGGTSSPVIVTFSDGTKFENQGKVTANYLTGQTVNGIAAAHAVIELSNSEGWTKTDGAGVGG